MLRRLVVLSTRLVRSGAIGTHLRWAVFQPSGLRGLTKVGLVCPPASQRSRANKEKTRGKESSPRRATRSVGCAHWLSLRNGIPVACYSSKIHRERKTCGKGVESRFSYTECGIQCTPRQTHVDIFNPSFRAALQHGSRILWSLFRVSQPGSVDGQPLPLYAT